MKAIISPTGLGIRNDSAGSGHFGSSRGSRTHNGTDFLCTPMSEVVAPFDSILVRIAYPYEGNFRYSGALFKADKMRCMLFYFAPYLSCLGVQVEEGQPIGISQDITTKEGSDGLYSSQGMNPHLHLTLWYYGGLVNPEAYLKRL